jgi:hypothetical protein
MFFFSSSKVNQKNHSLLASSKESFLFLDLLLISSMASSPEELGELLRDGARFGDLDDVREALAAGADVDAADEGGKTGKGERGWGLEEREQSRRWFVRPLLLPFLSHLHRLELHSTP